MTSRDLVIRTLNHRGVDRAPRDLWYSPALETSAAEELADIEVRYPRDIVQPDFKYPQGKRAKGAPYRVGQYTDAWDCTWHVAQRGTAGEVKDPLLTSAAKMHEYQPPWELLSEAKFSKVNRQCATGSRFALVWTETRPFERLQALRGAQAARADLAHATKEVRHLLAALHEFSCREMQLWAETDVDGVVFSDLLGADDALLLSQEAWRDLLKPLYRDYCQILHAKDKFVFFRAQGNVSEIFADLIEVGIDAIHAPLFLMNLEQLAERFRNRVTFWGEIDHPRTLAFGTLAEVRQAVVRVRRALDFGSGGLIAQCPWEPGVPLRSIAACFEQWLMPLPMHNSPPGTRVAG